MFAIQLKRIRRAKSEIFEIFYQFWAWFEEYEEKLTIEVADKMETKLILLEMVSPL